MRPQATAPAPCGRSSLLSGRERSGQARAATKALTDEARSLVPPPPLVGPCGIDEHGQLFGRQIGADDAQEPAGQLVVLPPGGPARDAVAHARSACGQVAQSYPVHRDSAGERYTWPAEVHTVRARHQRRERSTLHVPWPLPPLTAPIDPFRTMLPEASNLGRCHICNVYVPAASAAAAAVPSAVT